MFPGMVSSSSCTSGYVIGYVCKWICKYNLRGCIIHLASLPMCFVLFELLFWTVYHSYICICDTPLLSSDLDTNVRLRFVWDRGFCCISTFWWIYICVARVEFPLLPHGYQFCLFLPFLYMMLKLFRQCGIFVFVFLFFIILHGDILKVTGRNRSTMRNK